MYLYFEFQIKKIYILVKSPIEFLLFFFAFNYKHGKVNLLLMCSVKKGVLENAVCKANTSHAPANKCYYS